MYLSLHDVYRWFSPSQSDNESGDDLPTSKTRKLDGAASYVTIFNPQWRKEFDLIAGVSGDPYRYSYLGTYCHNNVFCLISGLNAIYVINN